MSGFSPSAGLRETFITSQGNRAEEVIHPTGSLNHLAYQDNSQKQAELKAPAYLVSPQQCISFLILGLVPYRQQLLLIHI
jgi:hypothetical protein